MSESVSFTSFPSNKIDAVTMLYLQNQDLSGLTPEQIADKYDDAYYAIKQRFNDLRSERNAKKKLY